MLPAFRPGDVVISLRVSSRKGDVVIARQNGREVIKRVATIELGNYYLQGDNMKRSTDSRTLGPVKRTDIIGRVIARLPQAVLPVKTRHSRAKYMGYSLAMLTIVLVLSHLYRIDTFIPLLDNVLPGNYGTALFLSLLIICSELASLPFLMSMRLSPLAHVVSGGLVVVSPLIWTLIAIWGLGEPGVSTGQLGEFVGAPATWWLLGLNLLWLTVSFLYLFQANYDGTVSRLRKRV